MVDFLSLKIDISKDQIREELLTSEMIGHFLLINPGNVKDVSPKLLEKAKRQSIIYMVCRNIIWAESSAAQRKAYEMSEEEFENLSPQMQSLIMDSESAMKSCTGDDDFPG